MRLLANQVLENWPQIASFGNSRYLARRPIARAIEQVSFPLIDHHVDHADRIAYCFQGCCKIHIPYIRPETAIRPFASQPLANALVYAH